MPQRAPIVATLLVVVVMTASCASTPRDVVDAPRTSPPPASPGASSDSMGTASSRPPATTAPFEGLFQHPDDPRVFGFVSSPWSFSTTSYAIAGDDDLIVIDTQFLPRETLAFVDAVERASGKRVRAAVVLHANPDKFNGTAALEERGVAVITSRDVAALIPDVHEKRVRAFGARYAPDYPTLTPSPSTFDGAMARVSVPGATVELIATGAGCSDAHVLAVFDDEKGRHVFAGDLLANGSHLWLELGHTDAWQTRLDEIDALAPTFVHPGRGVSSTRALIDENRAYLRDVVAAVAATEPTLPVDKAKLTRARDAIVARHATLRFAVFLNIGLPAVFATEARAAAVVE